MFSRQWGQRLSLLYWEQLRNAIVMHIISALKYGLGHFFPCPCIIITYINMYTRIYPKVALVTIVLLEYRFLVKQEKDLGYCSGLCHRLSADLARMADVSQYHHPEMDHFWPDLVGAHRSSSSIRVTHNKQCAIYPLPHTWARTPSGLLTG